MDAYYKTLPNGRVECKLCSRDYSSLNSFRSHLIHVHFVVKATIECPIGFHNCAKLTTYASLHRHLESDHKFECKGVEKHFPNLKAFHRWKDDLEQSTAVRFVANGGTIKCGGKYKLGKYHCHRSGKQRKTKLVDSEGRAIEARSKGGKGPAALGINCPALISIKEDCSTGQVNVSAYLRHLGHGDQEPDYAVQRFSKKLINSVLSQLKQGLSPEVVSNIIEAQKGTVWKGGDMYLRRCHIRLLKSRKLKNYDGQKLFAEDQEIEEKGIGYMEKTSQGGHREGGGIQDKIEVGTKEESEPKANCSVVKLIPFKGRPARQLLLKTPKLLIGKTIVKNSKNCGSSHFRFPLDRLANLRKEIFNKTEALLKNGTESDLESALTVLQECANRLPLLLKPVLFTIDDK